MYIAKWDETSCHLFVLGLNIFLENVVLHLVVLSLNIFLENVVLHLVVFQVILCGELFSTNHLHRHGNKLALSLSIFSFPPMKQNLYKMLSKIKNYRGLILYFHIILYLQLFVGGLLSYLHYLCLFVHSGGQHILCCVFALFFFIYVAGFSGLSIVITPSSCVPYVAGVSGLSIVITPSSCVPYVAGFSGLSIVITPSSCVPYVAGFSGFSIVITPATFSNVYLHWLKSGCDFTWFITICIHFTDMRAHVLDQYGVYCFDS